MDKSITKSVAQVGFHSDVRAESLGADVAQRRQIKAGSQREGNAIITGDFGRVEEKKLVNDAGGQCGAVLTELGRREIEAARFCFDLYDFNSRVLQFPGLG